VFHETDGNWEQAGRIIASDGAMADFFGFAVASAPPQPPFPTQARLTSTPRLPATCYRPEARQARKPCEAGGTVCAVFRARAGQVSVPGRALLSLQIVLPIDFLGTLS
jgi:FG-GAP repeat